jgi:hypothetical protein
VRGKLHLVGLRRARKERCQQRRPRAILERLEIWFIFVVGTPT